MFDSRELLFLLAIFSTSCANIQSISGGPEDKSPPRIIEENSSPNFQTHFQSREIIFTFDEWIRLDNATENISISPPLLFRPEYKLKGKKLIIQFDENEKLQEQTTYTIQFGECIKDITAGNVQRNFRYVFSTGDAVDSLSILGKVTDAFTRKPKSKILVSLYKNLDDTAFQKNKPFYFLWTDTAGIFQFNNIHEGNYRLYALEDKNRNYYFDQIQEGFAFYPEPIEIRDATPKEYQLNFSNPATPVFIKNKIKSPGILKIYFTGKATQNKLQCDSMQFIRYADDKDSMSIWNSGLSTQVCYLKNDDRTDTLLIPPTSNPVGDSTQIVRLEKSLLKPGEYPVFIFNYPVLKIAIDSFLALDSFTLPREILIDSIHPTKFLLRGQYATDKPNRLVIPAGAIKGWHEKFNQRDTFSFRYLQKSSLATLKMQIENLQNGKPFILHLLNGESIQEELFFTATDANKNLLFDNLLPGLYRIRLIHDQNQNDKWDPADFSKQLQAESIWYFDLPELRADWKVDVSIKL